MSKKYYYGGQAVIEGVMMRGRKTMATAVRRPNGEIALQNEPITGPSTGKIRDIPFLRGIVVLVETLVLGVKTLLYSASTAADEELHITPWMLWSSVAIGFVMALVLFMVLPLVANNLIQGYVSPEVGNLIEGLIRLAIFLIYLWAISLMSDIRRVFAYHGAEHKTINAYEAGEPLEVERVRKYSTAHSRCGTNFLMIVMVIGIFAMVFLGRPALWLQSLERLLILPLIAAFSYEVIRFCAAHIDNILVKIVIAPGLALQKMTTRQPDDRQIEVAISALQSVLALDNEPVASKLAVETTSVSSVTGGSDSVHLQH